MRRLLIVVLLVVACSPTNASVQSTTSSTTTTTTTTIAKSTTTTMPPSFDVTTPAFDDGGAIPAEYTCDGQDVSPELDIVGFPQGTQSLVLIVNDPDAPLGTWDHWVEFDIPATSGSLDIERNTKSIGVQGVNSWNLPGYRGPCPPEGEEHQYVFTVYALTESIGLSQGVESARVYPAMEGSVISSVELTGTYAR